MPIEPQLFSEASHKFNASRFESLGANCEFGFFLRNHGNDRPTLFKWAEIPRIRSLTEILQNDFSGVMVKDNVSPFNEGMIIDRGCGIAWHSHIHSTMSSKTGSLEFSQKGSEFDALWLDQRNKTMYLIDRFRADAEALRPIYVFKPHSSDKSPEEDFFALQDVVTRRYNGRVLAVQVARFKDQVGTISRKNDSLIFGYVDRFAPGSNAGDYSKDAWMAICKSVLKMIDTE